MDSTRPASFRTADRLTLEGVVHLPEVMPAAGIVVCHPHPLYGGDMNSNVVMVICRAAVENGMAALRFNFRGAGGSEGSHDGGVGEMQDVAAALQYLRGLPEIDAARVGLAGYSFGAAMALRAVDADVKALIAVSTPTAALPLEPPVVPCPLLLVSGDEDEYSDQDSLEEMAGATGAELVILPGVDHFWWGAEDRLAEVVAGFMREHLG